MHDILCVNYHAMTDMKNITEFIGIIKGVDFDGVMNEKEVILLENWLNKNKNLIFESNGIELIKLVESILEDKIIYENERKLMLSTAQSFLGKSKNSREKLYELNGIIEGLVCDKEINEKEIYKLKSWNESFGNNIREYKQSVDLISRIYKIIDDGIITEEEKYELLKILQDSIIESQFDIKLEYLCKLVRERKNIGTDLIDILDDERYINEIHERAEQELLQRLRYRDNTYKLNSEIIVISLVLIAMLEYDGNYYGNVRKVYKDLYNEYSEQKIEGMIRNILGKIKKNSDSGDRSRIINVALENAIVPKEYLTAFFEFVYDIYKLNFEYELSKDLYSDFKFVFEGLISNIMDGGDELSVKVTQKTYKLIASTKKLLLNEEGIDAIIKLSIVIVKIIDKRYWNKERNVCNPYLRIGFEGWEKHFQNESKNRREKNRSISEFYSKWEPKFLYLNKSIYLVPPVHKVKSCYDYRNIAIVVENDDVVIYRNEQCDIREIIGGYQVKTEKIILSNPIGTLTYKLMVGDEVIFDSKKKLHRLYIVFKENGQEIVNNTEYEGGAFFCLKSDNYDMKTISREDRYVILYKGIRAGDALSIENDVFNFSTITKAGIFGQLNNNCILYDEISDKKLMVYKEVRGLVFEGAQNNKKFEIAINENLYRLSDLKFTASQRGANIKYVIDMDFKESGIYKIEINQLVHGKKEKIFKETVVCDKELKYSFRSLNSNLFEVSIDSGLMKESIKTEINIEEFVSDFIKIENCGITYSYILAFNLGILNIDNKEWQTIAKGIWIDDISYNSMLTLYDSECDGLLLCSDKGEVLESDLVIKNKTYCIEVDIGFLSSYKYVNKYVLLVFTKDGQKKHSIVCHNKCIIDENETEILHFDEDKQILITPIYRGKNKVYFEMRNQVKELIYKSDYLASGETDVIVDYNFFEEYTFNFYEKKKMLMIGNQEPLLHKKHKFYSLKDFEGRIFKIEKVYYNQFIRGKDIEKIHYFYKTVLKMNQLIIDKDSQTDRFIGELFVKTNKGSWALNNINPVEIEVCSDIIDNEIDVYITNEGDGLLIDFEHHGIMNTLVNPTAPDIFLYTINVESEALL